jgi:hypothetical protein
VLHEISDAPLQVITAPHPPTGTTPRSLSAQHDSTAPDSALPNALFSSRVRSSGTGEGDYGEQTQDNLFFDDGLTSFPAVRPDLVQFFPLEYNVQSTRSMPNQSDHVIPLDEAHLYPPHRLCRDYYGPPSGIPATPPPLSPYLPNLARSVPGAVKPAPLPVHKAAHTTAEFSTRFSSPHQDSAAPDESSNSFFINGVDRSSGTGEGYPEEQTQACVDYDRKSQARVDHVDYDHGGCSSPAAVCFDRNSSFVPTRPATQSTPAKSNRSDYQYSLRSDASPRNRTDTSPRNDARPHQDARHRTNRRPQKVRQVSNGRASTTPALPLVETVSNDDSVLAGDGICATSADTAPVTAHRPVVWDIRTVKSNVPDAPPDLDFRKYFALSSFSRVHPMEYAFTPDIYDMFCGGAPLRICRDHMLRDFASFRLLDSNERWVTLFYQKRTNDADFTTGIGSRLRACLNAIQPRTPVSIQGRSVEQASLAPTATLDASKGSDPIDFVFAPEYRSDAVDFRCPPLHLQLSQLTRIHALRTVSGEGDSASVSTSTVAAHAVAYTDADLFETIRQIRGDEVDSAASLHLFHGEATFDEQALGSFTRHKLKQLPTSWDLWLASEWTQLDHLWRTLSCPTWRHGVTFLSELRQ